MLAHYANISQLSGQANIYQLSNHSNTQLMAGKTAAIVSPNTCLHLPSQTVVRNIANNPYQDQLMSLLRVVGARYIALQSASKT